MNLNKNSRSIITLAARSIVLTVLVHASIWSQGDHTDRDKKWMLGPFKRINEVNPILSPDAKTIFQCPMRRSPIAWEAGHVFNPAAVVREGKVYVLYRSEDTTGNGIGGHTSRIGLAISNDGRHFDRFRNPVIFPGNDDAKRYEWDGGCEDPRIVTVDDGSFVVTYTMWNRKVARLGVATSKDLHRWTKHGYVFERASDGKFNDIWSKSGSIVCRLNNRRLIAAKINGKYWMYWGEGNICIATSSDLIHWEPLQDSDGDLQIAIAPRDGKFDSDLVESGPPAIITDDGILLMYNGKNGGLQRDTTMENGTYAAGQALFDINDPTKIIDRCETFFFRPKQSYELTGQYKAGTVFLEGLVMFKDRWLLYYGTADSRVAVAECPLTRR